MSCLKGLLPATVLSVVSDVSVSVSQCQSVLVRACYWRPSSRLFLTCQSVALTSNGDCSAVVNSGVAFFFIINSGVAL